MPSRLFYQVRKKMTTRRIGRAMGTAFETRKRILYGTYLGGNRIRVQGQDYEFRNETGVTVSKGDSIQVQNVQRKASAIYVPASGSGTGVSGGGGSSGVSGQYLLTDGSKAGATASAQTFSAGINVLGSSTLNGGLILAVDTISDDTTLDSTYVVVLVDTDSAVSNVTITLPAVSGLSGTTYIIKNTGTLGRTAIVEANGSETIDGNATITLNGKRSICIVCDGSEWMITSSYGSVLSEISTETSVGVSDTPSAIVA